MIAIEQQLKKLMKMNTNFQTTSSETKEYDCEICKDETFILDKATNTARKCECYERKQYERMLENSGLSGAIKEKTLDNYDPNRLSNPDAIRQATKNKQMVIKYLSEFEENRDSKHNSLALLGQVGSGKTHLTIAAANELMENNIGTLYMDYREIIPGLKSLVTDEINYNNEMRKYKTAAVLLIDDLFKGAIYKNRMGEEYLNGADQRIMFEIINYRYLNKLPMIISSEYTINKLLKFDEAIGSRILEMCKGNIRQFKGKESNFRIYEKM